MDASTEPWTIGMLPNPGEEHHFLNLPKGLGRTLMLLGLLMIHKLISFILDQ